MTTVDDAHWAETSALFDQLLDTPLGARDALFQRAKASPETKRRVAQMLATLDDTSSFLDQPPQLQGATNPAEEYSSLASGTAVGAFVVERLIGRGGMGEVYLAHRSGSDFSQHVALKLLRPEAISNRVQLENERRLLAGLDHPGIARLIDGGLATDGRPYMAMEYVAGQDLVSYTATHTLDLGARLALFRQVCEAVDFAHRNLVVHRDLKPANILVDSAGRVRLLDFGIARLIDDASGSTQALLTPEYAAPEQFEGAPITLATDVFSLGVVLYQLLTGARPWNVGGLSLGGNATRRFSAPPLPPSATPAVAGSIRRKELQGDLDAIVMKALRPEPAQRYPGADALWRDIERHLKREPVEARGDARGYAMRRFLSRHRLGFAATAAVFLALAVGLIGTAWQAQEARRERDQVLQEMARGDAVKNYLLLMFRSAGENSADESTTAKQVFDQSAKRLAAEYRNDPKTYGELVATLGSLYLYMNDIDGAVPLLERYMALRSAPAAARADVGMLLAEAELRRGNAARAKTLLDQSQAYWQKDAAANRNQLVSSRQLQAQIQKEQEGLPASIRTLQRALLEHDAYFGRNNVQTANVLNSLGIAYQANGDIDKADAAFRDSWAVHEAVGNVRSAAALLTLGNWATVAYRKNEYDRAEKLLIQASSLRKELYGPSASLAAMQANLGKIILRAKRPRDALVQLE
ncbi:MAG: serine/threonine-protein kinase, partial [Pseudoxanthomonas sp.]